MNFDLATTLAGHSIRDTTLDFEDTLVLNPFLSQPELSAAASMSGADRDRDTFANTRPMFEPDLKLDATLPLNEPAAKVFTANSATSQALAQSAPLGLQKHIGQCVVRIPAWCVSYLPDLLDEQFYEAPSSDSEAPMLEMDDFSAKNGRSEVVEILTRLCLPFDAEGSYRNGQCETLFSGRLHSERYDSAAANTPPLAEILNVVHCDRLITSDSKTLLADYIAQTLASTVRNQAAVLELRHAMPLALVDEYEWLMQYEAAFGKEPDRFDR